MYTYDEMHEIVCDICGDGITLAVQTEELVNGGTTEVLTCWYEPEYLSGNGIRYSYSSECGIMDMEERTYDQIFPLAEAKRGPMPKNQFKGRDGKRRYRAYS